MSGQALPATILHKCSNNKTYTYITATCSTINRHFATSSLQIYLHAINRSQVIRLKATFLPAYLSSLASSVRDRPLKRLYKKLFFIHRIIYEGSRGRAAHKELRARSRWK
jgi:hypothetical protein